MPDRTEGPWQGRVRFAPGGGYAYAPNEILVRADAADPAERALLRFAEERAARGYRKPFEVRRQEAPVADAFVRFSGEFEPLEAIERLRSDGFVAQVDHVLFATGWCPPHPASRCGCPCHVDPPVGACACCGGARANPIYANPIYANPIYANPIYANPWAGSGGCCCCGGARANPIYANPIYANPIYANPIYANPIYANPSARGGGCCCDGGAKANPIYANPIYANADPSPFAAPWLQSTGGRRSSARPADEPGAPAGSKVKGVRVAILDTGWAETHQPTGLPSIDVTPHGGDRPDEDGDGYLDPSAGHGTFIAGVIEQLTPGCKLEVMEVLGAYGDGKESEIADTLAKLARRPEKERPHFVNLSFGGYSPVGMGALAHAIGVLHAQGTAIVASAGNDGTCIPMYPAALPEAVSVAALDAKGRPAPFTNYGEWVRACTRGVDVVSTFFEGFDGAELPVGGVDPDAFHGWACWSGTSFAAPRVVAALAALVGKGVTPHQAVEQLVDDPTLQRKPLLGTVVNP